MLGTSKSDEAVFHAFRRGTVNSTLPLKAIACEDAPLATLQQVQKGAKPLTVAKLRAILPAALATDPGAALALVEDLLGLHDLTTPIAFTILPPVKGLEDVTTEVLEAVGASGEVAAAHVARAPIEEQIRRSAHAVKEHVEALHALKLFAPAQREFAR